MKVEQVQKSQWECVWSSQKPGSGLTQLQGTVWHGILHRSKICFAYLCLFSCLPHTKFSWSSHANVEEFLMLLCRCTSLLFDHKWFFSAVKLDKRVTRAVIVAAIMFWVGLVVSVQYVLACFCSCVALCRCLSEDYDVDWHYAEMHMFDTEDETMLFCSLVWRMLWWNLPHFHHDHLYWDPVRTRWWKWSRFRKANESASWIPGDLDLVWLNNWVPCWPSTYIVLGCAVKALYSLSLLHFLFPFFAYFLACCTSRLCSLNVFMGTFWTFLEPAYLCIACLFSLESSYTCLHHVRNAIYTSPIAMITRSFQYADDTQLFVALSPSNPLSDITNLTSFLHVRRDTAWHTSAIQMLCFSALCICRRLLRLVVWPHQNSWRHSRLPSFPRWTH